MGTDRPDDLSAAKAEALALAGRIRDLRTKAEEHRAIAERERINADSFPEGSYEVGFSLFLSQDHEEKADDADKEAATLVRKHANAMEPFSNHTTWEENGATMRCECEGLFLIETLGGRFMARTCPLCGKRIHEWGYDDQGRRLARRLSNMRRNGAEGCRETEEELERLALARYLASEWYLLSGTPTSAGGFDATEEGYSFVPSYSKKGESCLKARYGKNVVHGVFGEMTLFDLLRTCVNDRQSPLYGGKIVPTFFLRKAA